MNKPVAKVARKNVLRGQEKETLYIDHSYKINKYKKA